MKQQCLEVDYCVVGGGVAGVTAALSAARNGLQTVLVQDRSVLGGNASSEIRMHIVGASCSGKRPGARESGLLDELRVEDAVRNPQRSSAMFDLLLYDKVRQEPNIVLLLDTDCVGCCVEENAGSRRITCVEATRNLTEEHFVIRAKFFADCTGDGRLGLEAGADFRMGREGRSEYGEANALELADQKTLGSTILFMARRHNRPMPYAPPPWARQFRAEDLMLRSHREFEYGYWWMEWGGEFNIIQDGDRIRHELLSIATGVWDYVKRNGRSDVKEEAYDRWLDGGTEKSNGEGENSASNWALEWIGFLPGKRESRRFLGTHVLTETDLLEGWLPPDEVAYGGWWIDLHPPAGVDAASEYPCRQIEVPYIYGIPLRSLASRNVENLFFAGRNISATHIAFASTRVMGTCAVTGQAIGTAAAYACRKQISTSAELSLQPHIHSIQQMLLKDDAFLPGISNQDPEDLAGSASLEASSEQLGTAAQAVADGGTRATGAFLHPKLEDHLHQWRSADLPAWIELRWPEQQIIRSVHLTFDTGFERELTLTMSDQYNSRMIRGPQPETVADYTLSTPEGWAQKITGNYQRKRVHVLSQPILTTSLRITVHRTNGDAFARIFEVRIY